MMDFFEGFEPTNKQAWLEKATADLKGIDPLTKFERKFSEEVSQIPYYDASSVTSISNQSVAHLIHERNFNPWYTLEKINVSNEITSNKLSINSLESGATGLIFENENSNQDLDSLLKNISLEHCLVIFKGFTKEVVKEYIENYFSNIDKAPTNICLIDRTIQEQTTLRKQANSPISNTRDISLVLSDQDLATIPASLARLMSLFVDFITLCDDENIQKLFNRVIVVNTCTNHYFYEIAKLRAIRILFAEIGAYYQVGKPAIFIQSETSTGSEELENLLSNSTQAMAAVVGTSDALLVTPHLSAPDNFSRRISKNVSNLLEEEAKCGKVLDPVAGSYYINKLTDQIVNSTWERFKEIEMQGGLTKTTQERIA